MKKQNLCSAAAELKKTMKISNSKKQLAKIIHGNGGWRDEAKFSAQDKDGEVFHYASRPSIGEGAEVWAHKGCIGHGEFLAKTLPNWHQTILSRDEYFHLYQEQGLEAALDEPFVREESKPTIEQLAADYRNAKAYANRKQQEADDAKADSDAKLKALELAGEALGLLVSPITAKQESELVSEVKVGDEVECVESNVYREKYRGMIGTVLEVDDSSTPYLVDFGGEKRIWCHEVKFIRRP